MEYVAPRQPLRHPPIVRLDHRKIQAVAHPVEAEAVRQHRRPHQPWKRAHLFLRQTVHFPRRIRGVEMLEMAESVELPREIERVKRSGAANRDFHLCDPSAGPDVLPIISSSSPSVSSASKLRAASRSISSSSNGPEPKRALANPCSSNARARNSCVGAIG